VPYRYCAIGPEPYVDFLRCNPIGMHATVMYDRERLISGGGFDSALQRCEDYDVYLRLSRTGRVASHAAVVADYRWHGANMSANDAEMLRWVLKVHARQKSLAAERRETWNAWKQGRKIWRDYYADDALSSLAGKPRSEWGPQLAFALRAAPGVALRRTARGVRNRILRWAERFWSRWPPRVGKVNFGDLGSTRPVSSDFGFDRGTPIDRDYIEAFLARHAGDIRGRVLEVGDASYSQRFGRGAVTQQDVLHVSPNAPGATIIGDLTTPGVLPESAFDCVVLTQTLHLIYDLRTALGHLHRALRPGGVVLLTVPGISQLDRGEWNATWSWSLTPYSARRLFAEFFAESALEVSVFGNVCAATAFLQGLALEEADTAKLDVLDAAYPVIVAVRARRGAT
jgi:SAM-dependent methyltransferase